ncbi:BP74-related protein [Ramlibacter sp. PS4R-6]|uniref:BP74-related protein n=1 Tax=Ramlibacter sp. PS4R-6 TaxID=3133438 RepID=UPI003094CEAF
MNAPARRLAALALFACLASCGGGGGDAPPAQPQSVTFAFRLRGLPASEEFRIATASPAFIAQVREQLRLPEAQRQLFVAGAIRAGGAGHNLAWSWHFADASLVQAAIELCDGRPSMVEANLPYWLDTVKSFCPWSSYAYAEIG